MATSHCYKKLVYCSRTRMGASWFCWRYTYFWSYLSIFICFLALLRSCSQCLWTITFHQVKVKVPVMSDSLWPHGLYSPWNSPGQNTRVGSLPLLQGIFPTQGSNSSLLHCRQGVYQLSHKGSSRILEWIDYAFASGSSQPRNWTGNVLSKHMILCVQNALP